MSLELHHKFILDCLDKRDANIRSFVEKLEKEILELKLKTEWQPIETAPKDGTWVLVYDANFEYTSNFIQIAKKFYNYKWDIMNDDMIMEINPTHWMPLPTQPKTTTNR